jgi:pyruvate dehydrogenase E1 component
LAIVSNIDNQVMRVMMAEAKTAANEKQAVEPIVAQVQDVDPAETQEWLESLEYVLSSKGADRVKFLLMALEEKARREGIDAPISSNTPYINTIPLEAQPAYPGNREIERRIKSIIRWNAMAMVVRANKENPGIGGHISTFASSATLYEVGYNHFFRGRGESNYDGDQIYFQGHATPGNYSRAFLEGGLEELWGRPELFQDSGAAAARVC